MTLGNNRKQLLEKLVQLAEDLKTDDAVTSKWRSEKSTGDGFNVPWECRVELMVLILNQLTPLDLDMLLHAVTASFPANKSTSCILLLQNADQKILVNGEKLWTHLFLYKMLVDPNVTSVNDLKYCAFANCSASFYSGSGESASTLCINPRHYEKVDVASSAASCVSGSPGGSVGSSDSSAAIEQLSRPMSMEKFSAISPSSSENKSKARQSTMTAPTSNHVPHTQGVDPGFDHLHNGVGASGAQLQPNVSYSQIVEYEPVRHWCSVSYYEGEQRLGETYHADESQFQIDGLTDPSSSQRFCLGVINRTSRDQITRQIRRVIDQGIKLCWIEETREMHVECISDHAVFFQSHCFNVDYNFEPHTVVKIPSGSSACVFRLETFARAIQYNLRLERYNYDTVYNMNTMCTVRISFVKGWGTSYKRTKITQCPCWVDITLNGPLRMLDRVLRYLHPPLSSLSSGSGGKNSPVQPTSGSPLKTYRVSDLSKLALQSFASPKCRPQLPTVFAQSLDKMEASKCNYCVGICVCPKQMPSGGVGSLKGSTDCVLMEDSMEIMMMS